MLHRESKNKLRQARHLKLRKKISGTGERPRLNIYRSLQHVYAQLIDDETGATIASASTIDKELAANIEYGGNTAAAKAVGEAIAKRALAKGIKRVVFDRGGYIYHGRVAAVAAAAREAGLEF